MKARIITIFLAAASLLLSSCTKEQRELMYTNQEKKIEDFINNQKKNNPDLRVVYNAGSARVVVGEGEGLELTARGKVTILYAGYDFTSGSLNPQTMFVTNNPEFAASTNWTLSEDIQFEPLEIDLKDNDTIDGLTNGLAGVKEGEECYILFNGKHGFGKDRLGTIPANAPLAFRVWVLTVEN